MESVSGVGVLDKSVLVLHALSAATDGMSLAELQDATGLPRATAHRLAAALEDHGLVRRNGDGRYVLGFTLAALAGAAQRQFPLAAAARPVLERLVSTTGESVQLYVREGDNRRCVLSLQSPHGLRWIITEGEVYPLGRGSAGQRWIRFSITPDIEMSVRDSFSPDQIAHLQRVADLLRLLLTKGVRE